MDKSMNKKFEPICVKSEVFAEEIKETTEKNTKLNHSDSKEKYKKLKRKYAQLLQEHSKTLNEFETYVDEMNKLCEERKFLRNKINCILKSQGYNVTLADKQLKTEGGI